MAEFWIGVREVGNHAKVIYTDGSNCVEENGNVLYVDKSV